MLIVNSFVSHFQCTCHCVYVFVYQTSSQSVTDSATAVADTFVSLCVLCGTLLVDGHYIIDLHDDICTAELVGSTSDLTHRR